MKVAVGLDHDTLLFRPDHHIPNLLIDQISATFRNMSSSGNLGAHRINQ